MKKFLVALFLLWPAFASADSLVVSVCGTLPLAYTPGATRLDTVDINGVKCSNSSGGGGGAVTIADGADVTQGALADAASSAGGTGSLSAKLRLMTTQLGTINTTLGAPLQAGGTVTANLGTIGSAATAANQTTANSSLATIASNTGAAIPAGTALIGDVNLRQGGTALSATNGLFANQLQGNAVLSATNPSFTRVTDGTTAQVTDPCQGSVKSYLPITLATAAVKVIATGVAAKKIYVCAVDLTNNAADSIAIFEATTATVCVTSPVAVVGAGTSVATAATGYNFAANGGISKGNGGFSIWQTTVNNNDLCIAQSAATQLTGGITYVTQ